MLALLSRFFLQGASLCLVWLEDGGDEEELVLARESSSDIPVWSGEEPGPKAETCYMSHISVFTIIYTITDANLGPTDHGSRQVSYFTSNFHYSC